MQTVIKTDFVIGSIPSFRYSKPTCPLCKLNRDTSRSPKPKPSCVGSKKKMHCPAASHQTPTGTRVKLYHLSGGVDTTFLWRPSFSELKNETFPEWHSVTFVRRDKFSIALLKQVTRVGQNGAKRTHDVKYHSLHS